MLGKVVSEDEREAGVGRRVARRARARVPVLIRNPDGSEVEGRTRDLSTTGMLVGIDGVAPAVGEFVSLSITNPAIDQEIDIDGTVMRHVELPGALVAVGIRFEVPAVDADTVGSFLREIQVAEHSRRLGGITGPISEIGIENLLQMFGTCAPRGTLTLDHGGDDGFIMFEQGMLRAARLGESYGRKALARLLSWREGTFEFHARSDPAAYNGDPIPLDAAMLDAFRLQDESQRGDTSQLPDDGRLALDQEKVDAARDELSQGEEAILDLAAVGMSIGKVIDIIPEPDEEIRQQIVALIARGLIQLAN